jgi:hypothetical protein
MTTQRGKIEAGGKPARSVLEGGNARPVLAADPPPAPPHSARGLAHAKTWRTIVAAGLFLLALGQAALAQYSIGWSTIDGGGGASTGGVYAVSGTIGQHDAGGLMTNGQYSVVGGFWALPVAVQTPGAPTLHITNAAPGFAAVWWTPPTPGFTLQSTDSLSPTNWVNAPSGTNNPANVPATLLARFYRLISVN